MLRREFSISAHEAEHVLPEWEREMLVRHVVGALGGGEAASVNGSAEPSGDPFSSVPSDLEGMLP